MRLTMGPDNHSISTFPVVCRQGVHWEWMTMQRAFPERSTGKRAWLSQVRENEVENGRAFAGMILWSENDGMMHSSCMVGAFYDLDR
jgi:hypothetical protein